MLVAPLIRFSFRMAAVSRLLLKRRDSEVANQRHMDLMDNGRTPGLQIMGCMFLMEVREREDEDGFRGSCCMVPMESRQKEDVEVSSQAPTLQFGSLAKIGYVCFGSVSYTHLTLPTKRIV